MHVICWWLCERIPLELLVPLWLAETGNKKPQGLVGRLGLLVLPLVTLALSGSSEVGSDEDALGGGGWWFEQVDTEGVVEGSECCV